MFISRVKLDENCLGKELKSTAVTLYTRSMAIVSITDETSATFPMSIISRVSF